MATAQQQHSSVMQLVTFYTDIRITQQAVYDETRFWCTSNFSVTATERNRLNKTYCERYMLCYGKPSLTIDSAGRIHTPAPQRMIHPKLRHKRSVAAAQAEQVAAEEQQNAAAQPARHAHDVAADLAEDGSEKAAKSLRITSSKILGTAQPRKPRIGPEYQAVIPPLPQQWPLVPQAHTQQAQHAAAPYQHQQAPQQQQQRPGAEEGTHVAAGTDSMAQD